MAASKGAVVDLVTQAEQPESNIALMFERLARDPAVDVEKLERLIAMQERILKYNAKAEFDAAFSQMQGEIPVITEKGQIVVKGELRSKYATNEDIQETVKPILQRHGFSLRFRNEWLEGGRLKVVGILSHRAGHSEQDEFLTKPDDSGSKNEIQAIGSARSYGQRYTTTALLNIATRGSDDNGGGKREPEVKAPAGFEGWWDDLQAVADNGIVALEKTWASSKADFKTHLVQTNRAGWTNLKAKAAKVPVL